MKNLLKHVRFLYLCFPHSLGKALLKLFSVSLPIMGWVCFKFLSSIIVFEACDLCCTYVRSMVRIKYFILLIKSTGAKIKLYGYPQLMFLIQSKISWLSGISKEEVNLVLDLLICCFFLVGFCTCMLESFFVFILRFSSVQNYNMVVVFVNGALYCILVCCPQRLVE